jgi:hypothetical protein
MAVDSSNHDDASLPGVLSAPRSDYNALNIFIYFIIIAAVALTIVCVNRNK